MQNFAEQLEMSKVLLFQTQLLKDKSSKGNKFKTNTDSNGNFNLEIFDGLYKIMIKADGFKKVVLKNQLLPFDSRDCIQIELKSNVPPTSDNIIKNKEENK